MVSWREWLIVSGDHMVLVMTACLLAVLVGIPLGIVLTRYPVLRRPVLGVTNVFQTVPSLALFGLLIPLPWVGGIGARTAIAALVLYALLPIVRGTVTGIEGVDASVREAAVAMGMKRGQVLWQIELPLAMPVVLGAVRVASVISVGVATIAAAIGAGGLGTYIFRGLRMNDNRLVLMGAVPAALMALGIDFALGMLELHAYGGRVSPPKRQRVVQILFALLVVSAGTAVSIAAIRSHRVGVSGHHVVVSSKDFTEQVILGELIAQMLEAEGVAVERKFELAGNLCHESLAAGHVDVYPEYTATAYTTILHRPAVMDAARVYREMKEAYENELNLRVSGPLGFRNDFAILVRKSDAERLNLRAISDIRPHAPRWRAGFGQDFMSREDGYHGLVKTYGLSFADAPREMDLSLTYRALAEGEVDVIAGSSTDGLIHVLGLVQLEDDKRYFPAYEAVIVMRRSTFAGIAAAPVVLDRLTGAIDTESMRRLNYEVDGEHRAVGDVVREWRRIRGF